MKNSCTYGYPCVQLCIFLYPIFAAESNEVAYMKNLLNQLNQCEFILLADRHIAAQFRNTDYCSLQKSYECFIDRIQRLTRLRNRPKLDILHALARIRERLSHLIEHTSEENNVQHLLLNSAVTLINFEEKIIYLQLDHPSLADIPTACAPKSPLYLSEEFTPTDLMELITALQVSGVIRRADGSPVDLTTLVEQLTKTFNMCINNPGQCRHAVINRKLRLTRFLDLLRHNLVEYSKR